MADNQVAQVSPETNQPLNPETSPETPQEANPLAEQFQRVAKQEKHVADERRKIDEARKAFEADKVEVEKYRSLKGKDPFEILEHFGITYDKLLEANNRRSTPVDPEIKRMRDEIEQVKQERDAEKKAMEREKLSRAEIKLMAEIDKAVATHEFDLIEKLGEQAAVRIRMEEMYAETGELPDIKEACEAVVNQWVEKFSKIKDSKWLKPKEEPKPVEEEPKKAAETISNKMAQSTLSQSKPLTEHERFKAAIAAMG